MRAGMMAGTLERSGVLGSLSSAVLGDPIAQEVVERREPRGSQERRGPSSRAALALARMSAGHS
jgi:hypothetical protein